MGLADSFLAEILGPGAPAVAPLRSDASFAGYVLPRTVRAWLEVSGGTAGTVPGTTVQASLRKSATGWGGEVELAGARYGFRGRTVDHAVAAVCLALGEAPGTPLAKDLDLRRLGMTIDALVKARVRGGGGGVDLAGPAAKPQGHGEPDPPDAPIKVQQPGKKAAAPKPPVAKVQLTDAEAKKECPACGKTQLDKKGGFAGCKCVAGLQKSAERVNGGISLTLTGWTECDLDVLLTAVGRRK